MDSSIVISSAFLPFHKSKRLLQVTPFSKTPQKPSSKISITANYSSNYTINPSNKETPFAKTLQIAGKTLIFTVATTLMASKFNEFPAKAEPLTPTVEESTVEKSTVEEDKVENFNKNESGVKEESTLSQLVTSHSEFVEKLWILLQKKLEIRDDEEALKILDKLVEAQPSEMEWKYVKARLLSEMGKIQEAIKAFDEILELDPLHIEALFEIALITDRGKRDELNKRCWKARMSAIKEPCNIEKDRIKPPSLQRFEPWRIRYTHQNEEIENVGEFIMKGNKFWDIKREVIDPRNIAVKKSITKGLRDVRLISALLWILNGKVDNALKIYDDLIKEDPKDCKPYFCKGMVYSLIDRNTEAKEQFAKYWELSPNKYKADELLGTPLSKMKLPGFGGDS